MCSHYAGLKLIRGAKYRFLTLFSFITLLGFRMSEGEEHNDPNQQGDSDILNSFPVSTCLDVCVPIQLLANRHIGIAAAAAAAEPIADVSGIERAPSWLGTVVLPPYCLSVNKVFHSDGFAGRDPTKH